MQALLIFFSFFLCGSFLCTCLFLSFFFYSKVPQEQETTPHYHKIVVCKLQICYTNLYRLFDKFRDPKHENLQHESCRSSFSLSLQYMESLFWIKEVEDIDPEIQTTQKFLGNQQIGFQYRLGADNYVFWNSHN